MTARWTAVILLVSTGCGTGPVDQPTEWTETDGYRYRAINVAPGGPGFVEVDNAGIEFVNVLTDAAIIENRHRMNGSGVAAGDVDGDGLPDLFFAAMESRPTLYRNLGNWLFADITVRAGLLDVPGWSTGAVLTDVDGDGDLDLFVTSLTEPNALFVNDGTGGFAPRHAGLESVRGSMTAAFADTDSDGDLDLYVANYKRTALRDSLSPDRLLFNAIQDNQGRVLPELEQHLRLLEANGRQVRMELGEPDQYYLNDGSGGFVAAPIPHLDRDWGLTARMQDITGDGFADLYVANDFESPDYFLVGDGQGGWLTERPRVGHTSNSSMSVAVADVNGDDLLDMFVPDMLGADPSSRRYQAGTAAPMSFRTGDLEAIPQYMRNTLLVRQPTGLAYSEVATAFGVHATGWSWGARFLDVDLDGHPDLLVSTGHSFDVQDVDAQMREREAIRRVRSVDAFRALITQYPRHPLRNMALRNVEGLRFEVVGDGWGLGLEPDIAHGMATADLDGDGDLDVVINRLNQRAGIFRNEGDAPRAAVRFRLDGPNTHGVGYRVGWQEVISGGAYLSGDEMVISVAIPHDSLRVRIAGPGVEDSLTLRANQYYEVRRPGPGSPGAVSNAREQPRTLASQTEPSFDDRTLQPLLVRSMAATGPLAHAADLDGDGAPELVLGAGRGGVPVVYTTDLAADPRSGPQAEGDWTGMASDGVRLYAAVSGYETGTQGYLSTMTLTASGLEEESREVLPFSHTGPLAFSDGVLFAGARAEAGRYPVAVPSLLIPGGPLDAGLVTGAEFGDYDGDGDADLAVSAEWAPLRVFRNDGGTFSDTGLLDGMSGLWQGVAWGDVDGDGRLDLVASNRGHNSPLETPDAATPARVYHGDFDGDGVYDVIEAVYREDIRGWSPLLDLATVRNAVPALARRVSSWHDWAGSSVEDLFGPDVAYLEASTLASTVFYNRGDRFEAVPLPPEAQWSSGNGVHIKDGVVLMAQNDYRVLPAAWPRQDAGSGLAIRLTNGDSGLTWLDVPGDQRSIVPFAGGIVITRHGSPARWVEWP